MKVELVVPDTVAADIAMLGAEVAQETAAEELGVARYPNPALVQVCQMQETLTQSEETQQLQIDCQSNC